jgi:cytochrome b561
MALRNTTAEFGSLAKCLHWLIAIGLVVIFYIGLEQSGMERGSEKTEMRVIHGSIALLVFVLMTVRLIWRFMNEVPGHPDGMPALQRVAATLVHWALYIAVFVQLISGPVTIATGGGAISFFGLFSFSLPVEESEEVHHFWEEVHEFSWKIVAAIVVLHILGALYNHFVAKNDVLRRMTTGVKQRN